MNVIGLGDLETLETVVFQAIKWETGKETTAGHPVVDTDNKIL